MATLGLGLHAYIRVPDPDEPYLISVWYWLMDVRGCTWGGRVVFRLDMGRVVCVRSLGFGGWEVRRLGTRRSLARTPPNDPCTTSAPNKLGTTGVPSTNPSPTCTSLSCSPQPSAPASNRLPNGAVYNPRCLTPPALSTLCGHSRCVGMCMFAIEQHAPALVFARVRMRGVIGHLVLVLGEGGRKGVLFLMFTCVDRKSVV